MTGPSSRSRWSRRSLAEVAENAAKAAASGWVARLGERIEVKVVVERNASYERASFSWSRCGHRVDHHHADTRLATRSWSSPRCSALVGEEIRPAGHRERAQPIQTREADGNDAGCQIRSDEGSSMSKEANYQEFKILPCKAGPRRSGRRAGDGSVG